jgi:hypothetical protein
MAELRVMSARGDDKVFWSTALLEKQDPEAVAAVKEAEAIFARERALGATAIKVEPGKPAERIDEFDETADLTLLIPRIAGG